MRTFAQKQNHFGTPVSSNGARSRTATPDSNRRAAFIRRLQRTIGNRGLQRMLQTNAGAIPFTGVPRWRNRADMIAAQDPFKLS